jgi:hypothetical protein
LIEESKKEKDAQGIYEANVIIHDKTKRGFSSFFPSDYSPEDVLKAIEEAYNKRKRVKSRLYEANPTNGILLHFYQTDDTELGKITSAYPKYQK